MISPPPLRLTLVLPLFRAGGGSERVVLTLLRHLDRQRFTPHLVTFDDGGSLKPLLPPDVACTHLNTWGPKQSLWPLLGVLARQKPQVVVSFLWHTTALLSVARVVGRAKFGLIERVAFARPPGDVAAAQWMGDVLQSEKYNRFTYPRLDHLVAQSDAMKQNLLGSYRVPPHKISVIPNPLDVDLIRQMAQEGENPFPGPGPHLLYVGRLSQVKDIPLLLQAFGLFHQKHGGTLTLVGEGEEEAALRQLAAPLGEAVRFAGGVTNPYRHMRHAHLLALSSRFDSFPNVLLEAHALGLPCVSTDCPDGPRAIVVPGQTGLLTPPGDAPAFAQALEKAWQMRQSGAFSSAAFEQITARHHASAVVGDWEKLLGVFKTSATPPNPVLK